jgi:hypothetical protein
VLVFQTSPDGDHGSPGSSFLRNYARNSTKSRPEVGRNSRLHADLDSFKGAKSNVSNQLCRRTGSQIQRRLPSLRILRADKVAVELLEVFITAVFERSLGLYFTLATTKSP